MGRFHKISMSLLVALTILTRSVDAQPISVLNEKVVTEVSRTFNYNEHAILRVIIPEGVEVEAIVADVSQLGGETELYISPELKEVTLSVTHEVEPGSYFIPITITDMDENVITTEAEVVVDEVHESESIRTWDEEIIYFLLTDRFYDGNPANNNPYNLPYNNADNKRGVYQGGDFKGITEKMPYLSDLGITTIWISPIVANVNHNVESSSTAGEFYGYHGYWAQNFEELNAHFGTLSEFHELIDTAADYDINIMVDVVLNHVGYGMHPTDGEVLKPPKGYPTEEERAVFENLIRTQVGNDNVTKSLDGLPDIATEVPAIREQIVDWQTAWVEMSKTEKGNSIESFRVDTVIHVDHTTWQYFRNELTRINPAFQLMGEVWGATRRNPKGYLNSGTMDSVLDFEFKEIAKRLSNGQLEQANEELIERNEQLTNSASMNQFLSSHDEMGFLYTMSGDKGKAMLAATLQLTSKGQPVIYYGEELGQTGANNWPIYDNRYDFAWDQVDGNLMLAHYQKLIEFRHNYADIMARGDRHIIAGSNDEEWLVVSRGLENVNIYIGFNVSKQTQTIELDVSSLQTLITDEYGGETYEASKNSKGNYSIEVTLPSISDGGTILLSVSGGTIIE